MGNLIYLYGIIPTNEKASLPSLEGIDAEAVYTINLGGAEAVVCDVREEVFNETALEEKMQNVEWLQEKAFHHHEMLMKLHEMHTVIPMKFCTIYQNNTSLKNKLGSLNESMVQSLNFLTDKEEWNLKIYCDDKKLRGSIVEHNLTIDEKRKEIETLSPGRQFLAKKKLDQLIDQEANKEKEHFSTRLHDELKSFSLETEVKRNWDKDVTGRSEDMCWNGVYLVPLAEVDAFLAKLSSMKERHEENGWQLELTGPWPSYHFANLA